MSSIDRYVSTNADIKAKRSTRFLNHRVALSYFHGYLQPLTVVEILPGDTIKANVSAFTRMSSPIFPLMDNIREEIDAWFVPKRTLWDKVKQFYGEATSFGIATAVSEPGATQCAVLRSALNTTLLASESIWASFDYVAEDATAKGQRLNLMPIYAYFSIYNEYYRDQNYQNPYTWTKSNPSTIYLGTQQISFGDATKLLPKVNKDKDLAITILPYQVKGNPVEVALGGFAPVKLQNVSTGTLAVGSTLSSKVIGSSIAPQQVGNVGLYDPGSNGANLVADLSVNASVGISNLLYALAYEDFLARSAKYGTRYREYIYSMFGTKIADATEDVPEYLGRLKFNINVNQVFQTTGFTGDATSQLGQLGAYSVSGNSGDMFTKSFTEPGYIIFVGYTKHQRTYSSGYPAWAMKKDLLDYYQPPFANIADVPISKYHFLTSGNNDPLGFQEPWFDYNSMPDRIRGILNPLTPNNIGSWTLAERFTSLTINSAFLEEDRTSLANALTTGVNGPDYLMDFQFNITATRVMPLYSTGRLGGF